MTIPKMDILGVPVMALTAAQAVMEIDQEIDRGGIVRLAYLNAHGSNIAASNPAFLKVLKDFWVFNDGIGVDIAARVLHGRVFPENLIGTDFTVRYLKDSRRTWRIYLLGAKPGVAVAASKSLSNAAPRHEIAGVQDGYFASEDSLRVAQAIRASGADILLVAMGNPIQEQWIADFGAETGCRVIMGVGALFDFLSGDVSRAPLWVRRLRSEWIYRLALEPRRLARRYVMGNPYFLARVLRARLIGH